MIEYAVVDEVDGILTMPSREEAEDYIKHHPMAQYATFKVVSRVVTEWRDVDEVTPEEVEAALASIAKAAPPEDEDDYIVDVINHSAASFSWVLLKNGKPIDGAPGTLEGHNDMLKRNGLSGLGLDIQ